MTTKWIEPFVRVGMSEDQILNPNYLFSVFNAGGFFCKACDAIIVLESQEEHLAGHKNEFALYRSNRAKEIKEAREAVLEVARAERGKNAFSKEPRTTSKNGGCYPKVCESCGKGIQRTGKPGRPPRYCPNCK